MENKDKVRSMIIRNVSDELHTEIKVKAAQAGISMNQYIIECIKLDGSVVQCSNCKKNYKIIK